MRQLVRLSGPLSLVLASLGGLAAFLYPFLLPAFGIEPARGNQLAVPLLFAVLALLSVAVLVSEVLQAEQHRGDAARFVALLAVLVALDAALRFVPSFIGASPIFPLIILSGYVFGARFGFAMGALTLLVSAILTGGIGPWLPYQMLCAGWIGQSAGWLPKRQGWPRRLLLVAFGATWGFLFGALMNLWFLSFIAPGVTESAGLYWTPGMSLVETVRAYARFYLATSLLFDGTRAIGNAVLLLLLGDPLCVILERWRLRLSWYPWQPLDETG